MITFFKTIALIVITAIAIRIFLIRDETRAVFVKVE